ncbi:hypothetical protein [Rhizobium laguerreae]|uniref:hypothetical protein n=1 Tax=Rhizobium laguerreae TaxID=1076926 RepID=UPI001441ECAB|nr:hypothetical protein [Rhizobium laguerreae]NKM28069.1 hypothetical protein [Rhizobium laguerreae]
MTERSTSTDTDQSPQLDDMDEIGTTGDDLYSSIGLNPVNDVSSNVYLVPSRTGGPAVVGYRIKVSFFQNDESLSKIIPIDDFIELTNALTEVMVPEVIRNSTGKVAILNYTKEGLENSIDKAIDNLEKMKSLVKDIFVTIDDI